MKTKEQVLEGRIKLKERTSCIYALIKDDIIVYVGQSVNVEQRVQAHAFTKDFDSYSIIEENVDMNIINELEADYIINFNPVLNKTIHYNEKHLTIKQVRKKLRKQTRTIEKLMKLNNAEWSRFKTVDVTKIMQ